MKVNYYSLNSRSISKQEGAGRTPHLLQSTTRLPF